MTKEEARARVARGAALLDRQKPGWARRIDVATLTLWDPCWCIVGQLCGGEFDLAALGIPDSYEGGRVYGFSESCSIANQVEAFAPLQEAWIEAIDDRLAPTVEWTARERVLA